MNKYVFTVSKIETLIAVFGDGCSMGVMKLWPLLGVYCIILYMSNVKQLLVMILSIYLFIQHVITANV